MSKNPKTINDIKVNTTEAINEIKNKASEKGKIITKVYGGQTGQKLSKRRDQHAGDDNDFKGMNIKRVFRIKHKSDSPNKLINQGETHIIKELQKQFPNAKSLNSHQKGGGGGQHNENDYLNLYIMYKME